MAIAEAAGEALRPFELGRGPCGPERRHARNLQSIDEPGGEGRLRTDEHEVDVLARAQVDQPAHIVGRDGHRMGRGRVAGGGEHHLDEWRLQCRPRERVLPSPRSDDQDPPAHPRTPSNDSFVARLPMSIG